MTTEIVRGVCLYPVSTACVATQKYHRACGFTNPIYLTSAAHNAILDAGQNQGWYSRLVAVMVAFHQRLSGGMGERRVLRTGPAHFFPVALWDGRRQRSVDLFAKHAQDAASGSPLIVIDLDGGKLPN